MGPPMKNARPSRTLWRAVPPCFPAAKTGLSMRITPAGGFPTNRSGNGLRSDGRRCVPFLSFSRALCHCVVDRVFFHAGIIIVSFKENGNSQRTIPGRFSRNPGEWTWQVRSLRSGCCLLPFLLRGFFPREYYPPQDRPWSSNSAPGTWGWT